MLQLRFDADSPWDVSLPRPRRYRAIFEVAQTFVTHDETLPPDKRSIFLPAIRGLLSEAGLLTEQKTTGEVQRTVSSEELKKAETEAKTLTRQVQSILRATFPRAPERAEEWGLNLKQGTHTIILPSTRAERLDFLNRYLAKEESRPPAERFTIPILEDVRRVRDTLAAALAGRAAGITQRETSVAASTTTAAHLSDYLQAALVLLLAQQQFTITPALQSWGYAVVARPSRPEAGAGGGTEESKA